VALLPAANNVFPYECNIVEFVYKDCIVLHMYMIYIVATQKENNWETKEMMERAVLTLETEQAKWPNPGCLL
jgi:hypothetical protein